MQILEGETSYGRHRRPESLADPTVLRPPPAIRVAGGRRTSLDLTPRRSRLDGRRTAGTARRTVRTGGPARGRHARSTDPLAITVRPLPVVRDAAEAVRGWALADSGRPPVTGSHRAPGTLPIESWLLIGRRRQQALLATLVAVGLMLIVVPMQQRGGTEVNPVNAADHAIATETRAPAKKPGKTPQQEAGAPAAAPKPTSSTPGKPAAEPSGPAQPPASAAASPVIQVPPGDGPAQSLRTTGTATVALTFDDGPDPVQTPKILELLAKYQVKATFCVVGVQVKRHPEIVRQIAAAGHTLCNHTWSHSLTIGRAKPAKIQADLRRTNAAIEAAVPGAQVPFFRAPGGNFTDPLVQTAYADGMTSLYWEVDPRDWEHADNEDDATHVEKIVKSVQKDVKPGAIVLSHDFNQPDTILAYEQLLPWLAEKFELGIPQAQPEPLVEAPLS
ncbi:polysaccharide deacetylase family protein [Actinoplanes sp. NPDC049599]|uniref:polysaccharide deacetylase family protein n=1 Tax=Actinoplanes sp. NPDC049599 TaxID=3363903 RepID=UPI0037A004BA